MKRRSLLNGYFDLLIIIFLATILLVLISIASAQEGNRAANERFETTES